MADHMYKLVLVGDGGVGMYFELLSCNIKFPTKVDNLLLEIYSHLFYFLNMIYFY